ncbi:hypothetical protein JCGZ_27033 [Jatropha curcas]|uniref:Aminotransferase-like plant mobile domain-containing protein n=1 Tax=Jatropha curcas TaxID=180498 RepID=A0A067JWU3_JATCU|nr:hypothetical protein JCGZ_27033 [Jatropha curcas]
MSQMRGFQAELRDAAVEWRGAGAGARDAAVLQGAQLGQSCVMRPCRRGMRLCSCMTQLRLIWARPTQATDAFAFWDLLDPPMRARVVAAGFGDYAAGLRRTQPRFPPAMRYALMERWNDCTHTFIFGFGEMTLTPVDYAAITGLRFTGPVPPLDARYQTATLGAHLVRSLLGVTTQTRGSCRWRPDLLLLFTDPVPPLDARYQTATLGAHLVRSLLGVTTQTRYTAQGCVSYEVVFRFWAERIRTRLAA